MLYENVALHNVAEVQPVAGGVRLQRVPEDVRRQLNPIAQERALYPVNCEIRFVTEGESTQITLSCEAPTQVRVFHGLFDGKMPVTVGPGQTTIAIQRPPLLTSLDRRWWKDHAFDPAVYRVMLSGLGRTAVTLHEVKGEGVRPPRPDQVPKITYLAYGTSITQGAKSEAPHLCYAAQTAFHLGADLINLGFGSSCHCEPALADYIAGRDDWHVASLEVSVNMQGFALDEFRRRVEYLVHTVAGADPGRAVACITLLPFQRDLLAAEPTARHGGPAEAFRQALRDAAASCSLPNVHLIEGPDLLTNLAGLTMDLVHPSDNGMIEIGRNLAARLTAALARQR